MFYFPQLFSSNGITLCLKFSNVQFCNVGATRNERKQSTFGKLIFNNIFDLLFVEVSAIRVSASEDSNS
jgi:hypothetical protein